MLLFTQNGYYFIRSEFYWIDFVRITYVYIHIYPQNEQQEWEWKKPAIVYSYFYSRRDVSLPSFIHVNGMNCVELRDFFFYFHVCWMLKWKNERKNSIKCFRHTDSGEYFASSFIYPFFPHKSCFNVSPLRTFFACLLWQIKKKFFFFFTIIKIPHTSYEWESYIQYTDSPQIASFPILLRNFYFILLPSFLAHFILPPLAINFLLIYKFFFLLDYFIFFSKKNKKKSCKISKIRSVYYTARTRLIFIFSYDIAVFLISSFLHRTWRNCEKQNCERKIIFSLSKKALLLSSSCRSLHLLLQCERTYPIESFRENMKIIFFYYHLKPLSTSRGTTAQYDMMIERHRTQI